MKKIRGFTLAEVLITLTILGVVAAISVPNMIRNYQDREAVTKVKRAYSIIDNALNEIMAEEGNKGSYNFPSGNESENINYLSEKLLSHIKMAKCVSGCKTDTGDYGNYGHPIYKTLQGTTNSRWAYADGNMGIMFSGNMLVSIVSLKAPNGYQKQFPVNGAIRIDINGPKEPNRYGYDVFFFLFGPNGLYPKDESHGFGTYSNLPGYVAKRNCNKTNTDSYNYGQSCAAWVLKHNNLDYKYRDVSAEW